MHAIRKLRESGHATIADYEKLLAPNVVFHSPVLIRTVEGRAVVAKIFATSTTLREGAYTGEWKLDDRRTLLRWKGKIQGHELESFDIIEENDEGLIVDRTIAFRPMPAAKLFRDAMRVAMGKGYSRRFLGIFKLELQRGSATRQKGAEAVVDLHLGSNIGMSFASFRRFWAVAARRNSSTMSAFMSRFGRIADIANL